MSYNVASAKAEHETAKAEAVEARAAQEVFQRTSFTADQVAVVAKKTKGHRDAVRAAEGRELRAAYNVERAEKAAEFADTYAEGMPQVVTDRIFDFAYREGHSDGYSVVESFYKDVATIVAQALR